jgi:GntR family hexuronate regulon transcriptional repressor
VDGKKKKLSKLYQTVAESIANAIVRGVYAHDERLPPERELAEEFGVSRPTIREAIIALEIRGLVDARHGSGVYVTNDVRAKDGTTRDLDIGAFELTEARRLLEGEAAALAATAITDAQLDELQTLVARMSDKRASAREVDAADREFHIAIARATQNNAMVLAIETLWDVRYKSELCRTILEKAAIDRPVPLEHKKILDALRTRDPRAARVAMREHLHDVIEALLKATEVETIEKVRADAKANRSKIARRIAV